jgi:hypothetical protein
MAFTDDFTRSPDEILEDSANWTLLAGTAGSLKVISNAIRNQNKDAWMAYACPDQGDDAYASTKFLAFANNTNGVAVRITDESNWIRYSIVGTGAAGGRLQSNVSGTITDIYTRQPVTQDYARVESNSTSLKLFISTDGSSWGTAVYDDTLADNTTGYQGYAGFSNNTGDEFDLFEAGALGGSSSIIPLIMHHRKQMGM